MDETILEDVRECGWSMLSISDHNPPFQYSVGLVQTLKHPEFIVFGLEPDQGHVLVSAVVREIRSGRPFRTAGVYAMTIGKGEHTVGVRRVDETQHQVYLGYAMEFARHAGRSEELEAMQLFWPDQDGRFPFDVGCDLAVFGLQPRLDIALTPREIRRLQREFD